MDGAKTVWITYDGHPGERYIPCTHVFSSRSAAVEYLKKKHRIGNYHGTPEIHMNGPHAMEVVKLPDNGHVTGTIAEAYCFVVDSEEEWDLMDFPSETTKGG